MSYFTNLVHLTEEKTLVSLSPTKKKKKVTRRNCCVFKPHWEPTQGFNKNFKMTSHFKGLDHWW